MFYLNWFISNSFYQLDYRNNQSGFVSYENQNEGNPAKNVDLFF